MLRTELEGDLPRVRGDQIQPQQLILNPLFNAGKANRAGRPYRRDSMLTKQDDENVGRPGIIYKA